MKNNQFENATEVEKDPNAQLEKALENATNIDDICTAIKDNLVGGYIDNLDSGHVYSAEEIIAAVKLAEAEGTVEIPTLYKVPGLQQAVAEVISESN